MKQIVIELEEEEYKNLLNNSKYKTVTNAEQAIVNGTVLSENDTTVAKLADWVAYKDNIYNSEWRCSNCTFSMISEDPWITDKYCRLCGRKMRVPRRINGLYDWDDVKKIKREVEK